MAALAEEADEWDPVAITLVIDDADSERRFGWAARLDHALNRLLGTSEYPWFEPRWRRHLALNLLLRTDLAIRLFEQKISKEQLEQVILAGLGVTFVIPQAAQVLDWIEDAWQQHQKA